MAVLANAAPPAETASVRVFWSWERPDKTDRDEETLLMLSEAPLVASALESQADLSPNARTTPSRSPFAAVLADARDFENSLTLDAESE